MEHKLIKTDNYLLVGSNDDLRRGWFYCVRKNDIFQDEGEDVHCCNGDIRITAHLPLNNSPILEGVDLLPPMEDDVEKLADKLISCSDFIDVLLVKEVWKSGYNKAKEKYKYTEKDIIEYSNWLFKWCQYNRYRKLIDGVKPYGVGEFISDKDMFDKFLKEKSLQQPKYPVAFECEMENKIAIDGHTVIGSNSKTTTNSQGQTVLVGTYKYEYMKNIHLLPTESSKTELPLFPKIIISTERQNYSFKYAVQAFVKPDSAPEGIYLLVEIGTIHRPNARPLFSEMVEKAKKSFISEGCQIINTIYDERKPGPWLCSETYIKQHVQRLINLSQDNRVQFQII
jgi:hypothetical protein